MYPEYIDNIDIIIFIFFQKNPKVPEKTVISENTWKIFNFCFDLLRKVRVTLSIFSLLLRFNNKSIKTARKNSDFRKYFNFFFILVAIYNKSIKTYIIIDIYRYIYIWRFYWWLR